MKITQEGDQVRLQLLEYQFMKWETHFDFKIHKEHFENLKKYMIEALEEFDVK